MNTYHNITLDEELLQYILNCGKNGITLTMKDINEWKSARFAQQQKEQQTKRKNKLKEKCDEMRKRNIYGLQPKDIIGSKIINEDRFKKLAWFNTATGNWQITGGDKIGEDWFCAIFQNGICIELSCTSYDGMCGYNFDHFFDIAEIENNFDLEMQTVMFEKWMLLFTTHILESNKIQIPETNA